MRKTTMCGAVGFWVAVGIVAITTVSFPGWAAIPGTEISEDRVAAIQEAARSSVATLGSDASDADLIARVTQAFSEAHPTCVIGPEVAPMMPEADCRQAAWTVADALVERRFPALDMQALEAEAAEMYPIYKEGDIVEVVFQFNPVRREHVRGIYRGRTPRSVNVGRWTIMVADIAKVKGNDELLLRLDAEASQTLRDEYVAGKQTRYEEERAAYRDTVRAVALREHFRVGAETNEQRGYVFLQDQWHPIIDAIALIVGEEKQRVVQQQRKELEGRVAQRRTSARTLAVATLAAAQLGPNSSYADPVAVREDALAHVAARKRLAQQEREQAKKAQDSADDMDKDQAEKAKADADKAAAAEAKAAAADTDGDGGSETDADDEAGTPFLFLGAVTALVLGTLVVALLALSRRKKKSPESFFKGKGKLQRDFWSRAEADPDGFKYVSYVFPDMDDAKNALSQLSFIETGPEGRIRCSYDIMYGYYPHQGKSVCFVGGQNLSYAFWREASAVLPELAGAEYFRVSMAPEVMLEIPDVGGNMRDDSLQIEHVENRDGEGDDYAQYYVYRAPDRENALEFLSRARVDEAGIHVVVETPDGTWGKDENGIYQE